ncbi:MAG: DUF1611 domain-containing protein, partial [SAR324 cluster bacterium]|nr:DUF1611 domain-containing protein [SAR324 cluster bacterium]
MNPFPNATISGTAIVLAPGHFNPDRAKTAFGLVRGSERFQVLAVIDSKTAGQDAGDIVDSKKRDIPVFRSVNQALEKLELRSQYAVIGITTPGGILPDYLMLEIEQALEAGLDIVNGLHQPLSEIHSLSGKAAERGAAIHDIRKPRPFSELKFWNGSILKVRAPRIAVIGTDCALGKRTTARWLTESCNENGIRAEMIFTGQTGWMQGHGYGFILDSTPNDFVPGELENAIVRCDREIKPDVIFLEGQASLRHPAGPCGAEFLCSALARGVILQHAPDRDHFHSMELLPFQPPSLE